MHPNKTPRNIHDRMRFICVKNRILTSQMNVQSNILVVDNFDSFTYNLVHMIEAMDAPFNVVRNDQLHKVNTDEYTHLLISPGPGLPATSGGLLDFIKRWPKHKPVLGVCLGMQAILELDGATIKNLETVLHGARELVHVINPSRWLDGFEDSFYVGRYHSWGFYVETIPNDYKILALDDSKLVMAVEHKEYPWCGVQYHPESIMTENGPRLLQNFLAIRRTKSLEQIQG